MLQKYALVLLSFSFSLSFGQQKNVALNADSWTVHKNTSAEFEEVQGRNTLFLNGRVTLKDFSFLNGTLQVDILANSSRSFAGIFFRSQQETSEEVYLRMHKSKQPDAVQYTPLYHGESNWQLYREHQVKVPFKEKGWNTLKITILNNAAKVYVNDDFVMEVAHLKTGNNVGSVGLWALFGNRFSNFSYTEGFDFTPKFKYPQQVDSNIISQWEISEPHSYHEKAYEKDFTKEVYQKASTEVSGLLPIGKYVEKPSRANFDKNKEDYVVLQLNIRSDKNQLKKFFFDYSDKAIIFLNKTELFRGNNAFRSKGIQHKGHTDIEANTLTLTLKKGINVLHVMVIEKANGWGFLGKFENRDDISIP
ncbi:family 16 glycoside hydrolase [Spongiimicrobium salis]|uniref:family 16 glycoside hydrolase n=1 Tax=Spongiimicrobium salis TaxID=1667022 RepID=UPI00374D9186